jgi:arylsulfatase A-like enzyme
MSPEFMKAVPESIKAALKNEVGIDYAIRDKMYDYSISEIDWSVGQILDALQKQGLDENTVVFFTSDNGPSVGHAEPLTGKKGSSYEGGMRVPGIVRWPGRIPAGQTIDELTSTIDLLPTFANLAGAEVPTDRVIDGKDIWPVLTESSVSPHEVFFYYNNDRLAAVRSGKWKLHIGKEKGKAKKGKGKSRGKGASSSFTALYDLDTDKAESKNVLKDHPKIAKQLRAYATAFEKKLAQNSRPAGTVPNPKTLTTRDK